MYLSEFWSVLFMSIFLLLMMLWAIYFFYSFYTTMVQNNVVLHMLDASSPFWFFMVCGILFYCHKAGSGNLWTDMKEVMFLKKLLAFSFQTVLETNSFLFRKMSNENSWSLLPMVVITINAVAMPAMTTSVVQSKLVEWRDTGRKARGNLKIAYDQL